VNYSRALSGKSVADCHWGPCYNCGVPAATSFECQTGEDGPRQLLVRPGTGETAPGDGVAAETKMGRWRYVGPPGDPRRQGSVDGAVERGNGAAGRATPEAAATSWPYNLMGTKVQSKSAGLSGLASLVEAAGGESTGESDKPPVDRDHSEQLTNATAATATAADTGETTLELIRLFVLLVGAAALVTLLARRINLPYTVALVAFGMVAGALFSPLRVEITPQLVLVVLLPALIFEASYQIDFGKLRPSLLGVSLLAGPGVLVSAGLWRCSCTWAPGCRPIKPS